jgi:hypothetical protein
MSTATKIVLGTIGISGFLAVAFVLQIALSSGA